MITTHPTIKQAAAAIGADRCESYPLSDILDHAPTLADGNLYVIRDGATVFYVGMSKASALGRVADHCGKGERSGNATFTALFVDNAPGSMAWQADILAVWPVDRIAKAEGYLIQTLKPYCNGILNNTPGAIPSQYKRRLIIPPSSLFR